MSGCAEAGCQGMDVPDFVTNEVLVEGLKKLNMPVVCTSHVQQSIDRDGITAVHDGFLSGYCTAWTQSIRGKNCPTFENKNNNDVVHAFGIQIGITRLPQFGNSQCSMGPYVNFQSSEKVPSFWEQQFRSIRFMSHCQKGRREPYRSHVSYGRNSFVF